MKGQEGAFGLDGIDTLISNHIYFAYTFARPI